MKISFNWLAEFVDIRDIDPAEVGHKLTMSTSEIEGIEEVGNDLERVVVGKIIDMEQEFWTCAAGKAKRDLGFENKIDLENGIRETLIWCKEHKWM